MESFRRTVQDRLLQEQLKEIAMKLKTLVQKWTSQLVQGTLGVLETERIVDYVLNNQKCKLPWSIHETQIAA